MFQLKNLRYVFIVGVLLSLLVLFIGIMYHNDIIMNVFYSLITGFFTGIICNVFITDLFLQRDNKLIEKSLQLLSKKQELTDQMNSIKEVSDYYTELISTLGVYLKDRNNQYGYFYLQLLLNKNSHSLALNDSLLKKDEIHDMMNMQVRVGMIKKAILSEEYSEADFKNDLKTFLLAASRWLGISIRFQQEVNKMDAELAIIHK